MKLTVRPLTPDLWPALEDLFGENGACNGCWCMYARIGSAYRKRPREENRAAFRTIVRRGPPPGLLAFNSEVPVGWCQLTPRESVPWLDRTWRLKRVDDVPVWSLSCLYVRIGFRRQGVTSQLIEAALTKTKGNLTRAAAELAISRPTLYELMEKLGVSRKNIPRDRAKETL